MKRISLIMCAILLLLALVWAGYIGIEYITTDKYYYSELGNPIYDYGNSATSITKFINQIGNFFNDMVNDELIPIQPTILYKVTYNANYQGTTKKVYVLVYGSGKSDLTQFNGNQNYFQVYAYTDIENGNLKNVFDSGYIYMWSYDKTQYGYLNTTSIRIYRATGSPSVQLITTQISNGYTSYVYESIEKFDMRTWTEYNFNYIKLSGE